jgi:hypothetical protein
VHVHLRGVVMKEEHETHEKLCEARATCRRGTTGSSGFAPHNFRLYITAVLPTESDDELDDLIVERGTPRASQGSPTRPLATRELPMPAQQSLGRDEKATQRHLGSTRLSTARIARSAVR